MRYLVFQLKGVLQHYSASRYLVTAPSSVYYKTEKCPTKKAVTGMIGAAMGIERGSVELDKLRDSVDIKYRLLHKGSVFIDYQTVRPLHKGDKFVKVGGGTTVNALIKEIEYLQDYTFEVYVGGEEELLRYIYEAFLNPVYMPYLGKRSCVPVGTMITDFETVSLEGMENVYDCP